MPARAGSGVVAAVAALLVAVGGGPARAVARFHVRTTELRAAPIGVTVAYRQVWVVAETPAGAAVVIRVGDNGAAHAPAAVAAVGRAGPDMGAVAAGGDFVWAAAGSHLLRIAHSPPHSARRVQLPGDASALAFGAGRVWVATIGAHDLLLGLDPRTLRPTRHIRLASPVSRLAFGLGSLWTVDERGLTRIDARTGRRTPVGLIGAVPSDVAPGTGEMIILGGGGIAGIAPTGREIWEAPLPVHGGSLAVGGTVAWATDDCGCRRGTLVAFDLPRRRVLARTATGTTPVAIAARGRAVWIANFGSGTLTEVDR